MKNFLILTDTMKTDSDLKTRVYKFCSENMQRGKLYIVNHYKAEGVPKSTIYRHIESYLKGKCVERKNGSGKPPFIATKKNIKKLKKWFDHKSGVSLRKVARRLNCRHTTILSILKKHTDIKVYKKTKKPDRTEFQRKIARPKCGKLLKYLGVSESNYNIK